MYYAYNIQSICRYMWCVEAQMLNVCPGFVCARELASVALARGGEGEGGLYPAQRVCRGTQE